MDERRRIVQRGSTFEREGEGGEKEVRGREKQGCGQMIGLDEREREREGD